ncbi:hypothetical protein ACPPVV_16760 [Rhodanobacter sp. Col0626]|uniref:hypothetical protein n=1 Tax=Rhodanobacter sp. Col0626 TaxID=3415679 RepID=UPI003CFA726F
MKRDISIGKVVFGFLLCMIIGPAIADDIVMCVSPTIGTEIKKGKDGHILRIVIKNESASDVVLEPFNFEENMLFLKAIDSSGKSLQSAIPLLAPGVGESTISAGTNFVKEIRLDNFFPKLSVAIEHGKIELSWRLSIHGKNDCSSQVINTVMTLSD